MADAQKIADTILVAVGILLSAMIIWRTWKKYMAFHNAPNMITMPGTAVFRDLKRGRHYIFVMHPEAFKRVPPGFKFCNLSIIDGADFRVREASDGSEIELEDCTGRYLVRFGGRRIRKTVPGVYSVRSFLMDREGDVELEVTGGNPEYMDAKVFISKSKLPLADTFKRSIGLIFLLILLLGAAQIVIMYLLEQAGIIVR
ncbi:MAG: hypothetical protein GX940_11275 [Clostridiaceae bacterium]|jgi:hypothetical protein|nr:hypothetical protein [Clostridiaceae bacterium]